MKRANIGVCMIVLLCISSVSGQQPQNAGSAAGIVPRLVRFAGSIKDAGGKPQTGVAGITFSFYAEEQGGTALWMETQNVQLDASGHYRVLLGATQPDGLPTQLFSSGEARWLGVQAGSEPEQSRVLLVAVPYALKAADAETLGGKPVSAFVMSGTTGQPGAQGAPGNAVSGNAKTQQPQTAITGGGKKNYIAKFTGASTIADSAIVENSGLVGIGTTTPEVPLEVETSTDNYSIVAYNGKAGGYGVSGDATDTTKINVGVVGTAMGPGGFGVQATSTGAGGYGVYAGAVDTTKANTGVQGFADGPGGSGVSGTASGTTTANFGVTGNADGPIGFGVSGSASGANGTGVSGTATNTSAYNFGVTGDAMGPGGTGVVGTAGDKTKANTGVAGGSNGPGGTGVFGNASDTSKANFGVSGAAGGPGGQGVTGQATGTTQTNFGVVGFASGVNGVGVYGTATDTTKYNIGVDGYAAGPGGEGVRGEATGTTAANYGVKGQADGPAGEGVVGVAIDTTQKNFGFVGFAAGPAGEGVEGNAINTSDADYGVAGFESGPGGAGLYGAGDTGVQGVAATGGSGIAGYFVGDVNISGNLSKGGGSFKIDHPLDPANKYLYHSFVESPDMMNVYNGNVVTNQRGVAIVTLPDYFEALNQDFRYQLTVIGQFAQAIVAKEINGNRFTIKTSKPGVKVSWQVTGIRHDAYADAHRVEVQVEKPPQEQGRYLHPELFGAPAEQAIGYVAPSVPTERPQQAEGDKVSSLKRTPVSLK